MTLNDGWASASVRVVSRQASLTNVPGALAAAAERSRDPRVLVLPVVAASRASLQDLVSAVEGVLMAHRDDLLALRSENDAEFQIFLGWSPAAPQESIVLDSGLVRVMAEIGAGVVIDTYSE